MSKCGNVLIIELKMTTERGSPWNIPTVKGIGFVAHEEPMTITYIQTRVQVRNCILKM